MLKVFFLIALIALNLYANDKVEIYASDINSKNGIVQANGDVIIMYKDYILSAKKAIYNKATGELELFENIRATKGNDYKILGNHARMNIAKKERSFKPFYMLENTSSVWLSGASSIAKGDDINTTAGMVSSCDSINPLWRMEFSSSNYNQDTLFLKTYNTVLYIHDIPILYTPFFAYSLDKTRRTGLLTPYLGVSDSEGMFFEQPIYIAEDNWWDIEIKPQIRTFRGKGVYATSRWVDSAHSKGSFTAGYFKEKDEYFKDRNLENIHHYGYNFNYKNDDFVNQFFGSNLQGQSSIYVDIVTMNDIDYLNLATNDNSQNITSNQIYSRINMFYNNKDNYLGAYFKYYKDLASSSNDSTLQQLPSLQYHSYLSTFLDNYILYSFDMKSTNFTRKKGKTAIKTDVNIPLSIQTSVLDEYINLSYTAYISAQHTSFGQTNEETIIDDNIYNDGYILRNYNVFNISTQQTKAYDKLTHTFDTGAEYIVDGKDTRSGYYFDYEKHCEEKNTAGARINSNDKICEFYNITQTQNTLKLYFSQYIYGDNGKQILYHKLSQNISYSANNDTTTQIENEFDIKITKYLTYYNDVYYNHDESAISKVFNNITYNNKSVNLNFSHIYQTTFTKNPKKTSYVTSSLAYNFNKHYAYHLKADYDVKNSFNKNKEIGFLYKKKCWDFGLKYVENNRPVLKNGSISNSIQDRIIYMTVALKPLMTSQNKNSTFRYVLPEKTDNNL
jgi:LPS-assembly protein